MLVRKGWLLVVFSAAVACVDLGRPPQNPVVDGGTGGAGPMLEGIGMEVGSEANPDEGGQGQGGSGGLDLGAEEAPGGSWSTGGNMGEGGGGGGAGGDAGMPETIDTPAPPDVPMPPDAPALKANGAACGAGSECQSGTCADQVCCNTACAGLCESCVESGSPGTCAASAAGTDPANECVPEAAATCRQDGMCNGARACRLYVVGTSCGGSSCSAGVETMARVCDGYGTCTTQGIRACTPHLCGATACASTCATPAECVAGASCIGSTCVNASGLQLYWNLDESSGVTAGDFSGQGRHGTYEGTGASMPTPSTLVPTSMFSNPRSRDFSAAAHTEIRLRNLPAALLPSNNVTLSAWFRATNIPDPSGYGELISIADGFALVLRPGLVSFSKRVGNNNYLTCDFNTTGHLDGRWHHLAGTSTAGSMIVYLDGVARTSLVSASSVSYGAILDLLVGADMDTSFGAYFNGNLDEVRVYNRVLSATEIAALAAGGR